MAKLIEKDGKFYRMRRGKLVEIPEEWLGQHTWKRTKNRRKKEAREFRGSGTRDPGKKPKMRHDKPPPPIEDES